MTLFNTAPVHRCWEEYHLSPRYLDQLRVPFNRLFYSLRLNADVPLSDGRGPVL